MSSGAKIVKILQLANFFAKKLWFALKKLREALPPLKAQTKIKKNEKVK